MQLAEPPAAAADLSAVVSHVLDRRLLPDIARPIALALSGGGDSVALLVAAQAWAQRAGRPLLALTVDHGLQPQSSAWTAQCAALAARLGVGFQALAWSGDKPRHGLAAAARAARHRLLADATRAAGARVLLLGHTADDVLEAQAMRQAGATTPSPWEWSPSPAWPQGRGLFLLRPLLGVRRQPIRDWLRAQGFGWIEDPANAAKTSLRAQVRRQLGQAAAIAQAAETHLPLADAVVATDGATLDIDRATFLAAGDSDARRVLATAAVCAGGGDRLPSAASATRVVAQLRGGGPVTASLAGARITADTTTVRWTREAGEAARGGLAAAPLPVDEPFVWDGRFVLRASTDGLQVRRLSGLTSRLPLAQRRLLARLPADARSSLPAVVRTDGAVSCPLLGPGLVTAESLVGERFRAACGLTAREPA